MRRSILRGVDLDADRDAAVHRHRERLGSPHPSEPAGERDRAGQRAAEPLGRALGEGLVRALQDPLGPDVDPRPGRHLAVHRESRLLELAEGVPVGPLRHEHRVRDQDARGHLVGAEHAHRLPGLDQERLVVAEVPSGCGRSRRMPPRTGPRDRFRRRRRGPRGARRPRDRGCSSTSASRLPAATSGSSARIPSARVPHERPSAPSWAIPPVG